MLVDSHCHLDKLNLASYGGDLDKALIAAKKQDVQYFLSAGIDLVESKSILSLAQKYPFVKISAGLHPTESIDLKVSVSEIVTVADNPQVIGIGETGLDFWPHNNKPPEKAQKEAQIRCFREHIRAALELKKPLIIHSRAAGIEALQVLEEERGDQVGGVFHCFADEFSIAKRALELGFYIGISGIVTFKNARSLQEIVSKLPLSRILLETDAPFLAPVPFRGKPNEPAYLFYIAEYIAKLKKTPYEILAEQTSNNFFKLFLF